MIHLPLKVHAQHTRLSDATTQSEDELQQANKYYWSLDDDIEGVLALGNENHQLHPL